MQTRKANSEDLPAIISLLKVSLGESLIPKSEELWKWKHISNPFGASPMLVADDNGLICGVRVFLRWEFRQGKKLIKACRAVDTAIHPDYQGKGLFKNLTLSLVEELKEEGVDLIYNTPNSQSTPGYLKMDWEKWGKLPLKMHFNLSLRKSKNQTFSDDWSSITPLFDKIENGTYTPEEIRTNLVSGYLHWRYVSCPLFPYHLISDGATYLLIYRIKEGKIGRELRIVDFFELPGFGENEKKQLNSRLKTVQKNNGVRFTSFSGLQYKKELPIELGHMPVMSIGPEVTLRKVANLEDVLNMPWAWSLGDLEVF
ncbi:N-acetylglutamate synthase-like GNAT family acetyltransferase [Algoriphagus ratkowskyi]|uniref:GNAT family N-acetyltransferase n=1 Tax=Algoriphagus ratkowskyi TaxID=57028 RepID=A0A2W7R7T6_9BACT|nr:GNAT family N-acetyltransferase [Algoriphagus ratkowskyi]PZX50279.1 N-acetylglutamate synthase-like GNAT family acetyltransferase [Algoriphagus ratkowskyi]TXD75629.1 GNAT family N-acetyltransferase [Algoriphagus ratkowskyi]